MWDRAAVGWHLAFGVFALVTGVLVVNEQGTPATRETAALVLLVMLCVAYATMGAGQLHAEPRQRLGLVYVALAVPVTVAMFAVMPQTSVMLFVLYPHIWCLLPTRRAVWATTATSVSVGVVVGTTDGPRAWGLALVLVVLGLALALVLGLWIGRIIDQSTDRARLAADLAATRHELALTSREAGVLAERARLARDLHDTLAQGSISVLMLLQAARNELGRDTEECRRHLALAEQTTSENLGEIRALVAALTPTRLDGVPLLTALRGLAEELGQATGTSATVSVAGDTPALPRDHEVIVLRAAQEALANVRRHAFATNVGIELRYDRDRVTLRVTDDGRGFDATRARGFGLAGLRARAAEMDGEVDVDTVVGSGTTVTVTLPVASR
jgi:signal transduction histidine kinase